MGSGIVAENAKKPVKRNKQIIKDFTFLNVVSSIFLIFNIKIAIGVSEAKLEYYFRRDVQYLVFSCGLSDNNSLHTCNLGLFVIK